MKVPQVQPWIGEEEAQAVADVVRSGWITEGPKCRELHQRLNELLEVEYGVFAPNGTLALYLGLVALGIGNGDEVIVPDMTFIASANAVLMADATPVFCEVNSLNFQMTAKTVEQVVTDRTRAIMPVHLYGMCAAMEEIVYLAEDYNLFVIEDAAQALGLRYKHHLAGTWGNVGCFSFFADKSATMGEGGYVVCQDGQVYDNLLHLRNQGRRNRGTFIHPQVGYNFRITDMQAAMGLVQLKKLPKTIKRKEQILEWYEGYIGELEQVEFSYPHFGSSNVPFRVILMCKDAHELMEYLRLQDIHTRTAFYPLHKQPCFRFLEQNDDSKFPNANFCYDHGVCLPAFPELTEEQVEYVCDCIKEFYASR
jgi:perosamine synthetase